MYCPKLRPYIRFMEVLISSMGHWPYQTTTTRVVMRIIYAFALITLSLPLAISMYKTQNDFDSFIVCLPMAITVLLVSWTYFLFFVIKRQELLLLLKHVSDDFTTLQSFEAEIQILKQSADEGRLAIFVYIVYTVSSIIFYCSITLIPKLLNIIVPLNESRPLSYISEVDYVFIDRSDYYFLSFIHTASIGSYCVMLVVGGDMMLCLFSQHACGMFRVLQYRLKNILNTKQDDQALILECHGGYHEDKTFRDAVACIQMYRRILQFTEDIDSCFSLCLLAIIGITIVLLSFEGAMIIFKLGETEFVIRYGTYAFAQIIHLLYNSIVGQRLLDHSTDVTNYIYNVEWYGVSRKVKKLLLVMMIRSLKESNIKIGKMFVLCLETHCSIMKTIFSYLSVLTSMRG